MPQGHSPTTTTTTTTTERAIHETHIARKVSRSRKRSSRFRGDPTYRSGDIAVLVRIQKNAVDRVVLGDFAISKNLRKFFAVRTAGGAIQRGSTPLKFSEFFDGLCCDREVVGSTLSKDFNSRTLLLHPAPGASPNAVNEVPVLLGADRETTLAPAHT